MANLIDDAKCPTCEGPMLRYGGPYCPMCTSKAKIKKNLIQSIDYIEHKYKIQTRDYGATKAGILDSISFNCDHEEKWKNAFAPIPEEYLTDPLPDYRLNQKGMDFCNTPEGREFFRKRDDAYENAPDGEAKEIPYLDWWHFFCDLYTFTNDCWIVINWQYVYDNCNEDWQREITKLFVDEFGKRDIKIEISW
jgi:hypothetical protein